MKSQNGTSMHLWNFSLWKTKTLVLFHVANWNALQWLSLKKLNWIM